MYENILYSLKSELLLHIYNKIINKYFIYISFKIFLKISLYGILKFHFEYIKDLFIYFTCIGKKNLNFLFPTIGFFFSINISVCQKIVHPNDIKKFELVEQSFFSLFFVT